MSKPLATPCVQISKEFAICAVVKNGSVKNAVNLSKIIYSSLNF